MDQYTGQIKAIVGGRGEKTSILSLRRATDSYRQPGSCFKILASYAPALNENKLTLATTIDDEPGIKMRREAVGWRSRRLPYHTIREQ